MCVGVADLGLKVQWALGDGEGEDGKPLGGHGDVCEDAPRRPP